MSKKADNAKVSTTQAEELQREAEATLTGLQPGSLTGMLSRTHADWATITRSMPKTPLISSAAQDVMRKLASQRAGLAKSFSLPHSEQFLGIARLLQSQHVGVAARYFRSLLSNAGRVPSRTSTMARFISGFSIPPLG